jgi:Protein of unknown function (DUF2971)
MRLYKYLSPERLDVLRYERIRFSQPNVFNDPFELSTTVGSIFGEGVNPLEQAAAATDLGNQLLGMVEKVASKGLQETVARQFGVLTLTERPDNLLMWAHYARNHEGFVLEVDATHAFFDRPAAVGGRTHRVGKVAYSQTRPAVALTGYKGVEALFVKSAEWEYEQEWRMVLPLSESIQTIETPWPPIHLFPLPPAALSGVILGCRMTAVSRTEILSMLANEERYAHIAVRQANLEDRTFALRLTESPFFHHQKALKAINERRFDDALAHAERAIEVAPDLDKGRHYGVRALVRFKMGDQRGFIDDMSTVKRLSPDVYSNLLKDAGYKPPTEQSKQEKSMLRSKSRR